MALILVHPKALNTILSFPDDFSWFYADDSVSIYQIISEKFGDDRCLLSPKLFQEKAANLRHDFVSWLDSALDGLPADSWISSSVFKDIFITPVFLHSVALVILGDAIRAGNNILLVTTSDILVDQILSREKESTVVGKIYYKLESVRITLQAWRQWIWRPIRFACAGFMARYILGKAHQRRLQSVEVLVDTFLLDGDLQSDGAYHNRFLPGLFEYYQEKRCVAAAFSSTEALKFSRLSSTYRAMNLSHTLFAPPEFFIRPLDIFLGALKSLVGIKSTSIFSHQTFKGIDIEVLASRWWRIASLRTAIPHTLVCVAKKMHTSNMRPDMVLVWFENQASQKALQLAFDKYSDTTELVALHQYFPFPNVINFFSTNGEVLHGLSAKKHWVCGKTMLPLFSAYDHSSVYQVVPALRYNYLYGAQGDGLNNKTSLMVFLTSDLEESLCILDIAFSNIHHTLTHFDSIVIKPHQALNIDFQSIVFNRWPDVYDNQAISWKVVTVSNLLHSANLVLTAGSSVALEAIISGIPVVIVGRKAGLELNSLDGVLDSFWRMVYSSSDFKEILSSWFQILPSKELRREYGQEILAGYFEPITEVGMRVFLPKKVDKIYE
jgi:hypothetical protein